MEKNVDSLVCNLSLNLCHFILSKISNLKNHKNTKYCSRCGEKLWVFYLKCQCFLNVFAQYVDKNADSLVCNLKVLTDAPPPPQSYTCSWSRPEMSVFGSRGLTVGADGPLLRLRPIFITGITGRGTYQTHFMVATCKWCQDSGLTNKQTHNKICQEGLLCYAFCWLKENWMCPFLSYISSFSFSHFLLREAGSTLIGADILFPPRCHIGSGICPLWFPSQPFSSKGGLAKKNTKKELKNQVSDSPLLIPTFF